ncbi:hypothetical protein PHJA_002908500 [Phtheirospermum japonicum]|uniref:Uncharacterized protein n=1 Tax=Phtheirospermum japonicum TaxID=374723 RepID=A0A830DJ40_9LAMI|nr:hypothetical protein PHJA_002908500 [Phtheirospermum japonicum]
MAEVGIRDWALTGRSGCWQNLEGGSDSYCSEVVGIRIRGGLARNCRLVVTTATWSLRWFSLPPRGRWICQHRSVPFPRCPIAGGHPSIDDGDVLSGDEVNRCGRRKKTIFFFQLTAPIANLELGQASKFCFWAFTNVLREISFEGSTIGLKIIVGLRPK